MIKRTVGTLLGALSFGIVLPGAALLLGWVAFGDLLTVVSVSAAAGAILGWLRPDAFLKTVLFFVEPSVFD